MTVLVPYVLTKDGQLLEVGDSLDMYTCLENLKIANYT